MIYLENKVLDLDEKEFYETQKSTEKLVIVEFYTTTCPNCRAIAPVFEELSDELQKYAVFTKVNAETNTALASRYGIMGVPTFKFYCKEKPIGELVGSVNTTLLRNTIKDLIKHKNECVSKTTPITYEIDGYG